MILKKQRTCRPSEWITYYKGVAEGEPVHDLIAFRRLYRFMFHFNPRFIFPNSADSLNRVLPEHLLLYRFNYCAATVIPFLLHYLIKSVQCFESFWQMQQHRADSSGFFRIQNNSKVSNTRTSVHRHPIPEFLHPLWFSLIGQTCRSSVNAWYSWHSRNWSSTSWSKVGRRRSARSWRARAGPHILEEHLHLQRQSWETLFILKSHIDINNFFFFNSVYDADNSAGLSLFNILTLLCFFNDPHFSCGTHRVDAGISIAGVGALIRRLYIIKDQAAVRWCEDAAPIWTHRYAISVFKEKQQERLFCVLGL